MGRWCSLKNNFVGYFDGSSVPNPGEMTIGGHIINEEDHETICTYSKKLGEGTNNQAEYLSLIELLKQARNKGISKITIKGDSLLVVNQVNELWRTKNSMMKRLQIEVLSLLEDFDEWKLEHVYRNENKEADSLTR
jgi:ribonuclease HI